MTKDIVILATRGSALALAQANLVLAYCRQAFPELQFETKIVKTTGDKLQTAALANPEASATKGLFTKELEAALLNREADLAVHSLKDLPTDLPAGLELGAVCQRADARDVLIYRGTGSSATNAAHAGDSSENRPGRGPGGQEYSLGLTVAGLRPGATIATSSTRRQAQLLALRPDLKVMPIRGNVGTRLQKLAQQPEIDATILAAAGLARLYFEITSEGRLRFPATSELSSSQAKSAAGEKVVHGLCASRLEPEVMLPCVGQGAIGIEVRADDKRIADVCAQLNHSPTWHCVVAERAFLHTMGGGCQSPVAAFAEVKDREIHLRVVSFRDGPARRAEGRAPLSEASSLGDKLARRLLAVPDAA
jgi:hydroxymethylbilane synthase